MAAKQRHPSIHRSLVTGCSLAILLASVPLSADARRQLIPDQPSVEVNLDVLRALENRAMGHQSVAPGTPFQVGASEAVKRGGGPKVAPKASVAKVKSGRRRPTLNQAKLPAPPVASKPRKIVPKPAAIASKPAPKPAPVKKAEPVVPPKPKLPLPEKKPASSSSFDPMMTSPDMPPLRPTPASPPTPEPAMPEPIVEMPVMPEPTIPEPAMPEPMIPKPVMPEPTIPEPAMPDLPEPDMSNMQFEEFPTLQPLPDTPSAAPPEPLMPALPPVEVVPAIAPPETPAPIAPVPSEPVLPALSETLDNFIGTTPAQPLPPAEQPLPDPAMISSQPEPFAPVPEIGTTLPSLEAITGDAPPPMPAPLDPPIAESITPPSNPFPPLPRDGALPPELPSMPSFDNVPATVTTSAAPALAPPTEMAALPSMGEPIPEMPAIEAPAPLTEQPTPPSTGGGSQTISIEFAATENEIPVSAQGQLSKLASSLISSGQSVTIRPFVGGTAEESALANVIGTRRAFAVRTYLIDKGVSHFNISIDRNQIGQTGTPERVDVVVN